ncbi:polysaccharide biosynthesis protein, partial [bacterium]|nr:polysaccharide biosynthesis protein [bacterium]
LSTDKAVYPINAMGMSKAMMEKLVVAKSRLTSPEKTRFCCTRYGNVMASRGSVIPLFVKQILESKPITITDPNMTRFLMSLDDAVDLVMHALNNAEQGDTFVQKAPASTIGDLATALLEIFSASNEIQVIGTRHGEKLFESLLTKEEMDQAEEEGEFYRIPADHRDLNYNKYVVEGHKTPSSSVDYNSHNTTRLNVEQVKEKLLKLPFIEEALKGRFIS